MITSRKSQRDEIFIENNFSYFKRTPAGLNLFTVCRSAGAFGKARVINL